MALVKVCTGEGALSSSDDGAVGAGHASSELLRNSTTTVAKTKGVTTNADNSTVIRTRGAVFSSGGRGGSGRGNRCRRSHRGSGRDRLGSGWCGGNGCRGSTRSEKARNGCNKRGRGDRSRRVARSQGDSWSRGRWDRGHRGRGNGRRGGRLGRSRRRRTATRGLSGSANLSVTSTQFSHSSAASTREGVTKVGAVAIDHGLAGIGVVEILTLNSGTLGVRKVGNKHVGERGKGRSSVRRGGGGTRTANLHRSAIHVELAVANLVQPGPSKRIQAIGHILGHSNGECRSTMTGGILGFDITTDIGWTATNNAVYDLPLTLLSRLSVRGQGELARTASMNRRANERDRFGLTGVPLVHLADFIHTGALFAGELARCKRGAVDCAVAVWNGKLEVHVRGSAGSKGQDGESLGEHLECAKDCRELNDSGNR